MSKPEIKGMLPVLRFPEFQGLGLWEVKPFDELFTIGNGKDYKHLSSGEVPVYGSGGYMLSVNDYLHDGESVCIGRKGTINNPMFLTEKFWTVDTLFYTHSFNDCLPRFIYSIFKNIDWLKHNEAGGVPSLSKINIGKIKVAVPKPNEQQKIADCLSSIDELVTAQTQKLDALKAHKKGLMQQLFPAEGETLPKLRFPEFQDAGEWEVANIKDIASVVTDYVANGSFQSLRENVVVYASNNFSFYVRLTDLRVGLGHKEQKYVDESSYYFLKKSALFGGELLMANIGANVGEVWLMPITNMPATLAPNMIMVKFKTHICNEFVYYFMDSEIGKDNISTAIGGGAHPKINKTDLKQVIINLPKTLQEQQKIADCLSSVDELISAQTHKIGALKAHKKGLMQQLFPAMDEVNA